MLSAFQLAVLSAFQICCLLFTTTLAPAALEKDPRAVKSLATLAVAGSKAFSQPNRLPLRFLPLAEIRRI
jgi:hypothetical protein